MKKSKIIKRISLSIIMGTAFFADQVTYAACTFLQQLPTSNITDPDKLRGNNMCSADNNCQPGTYCSSFGRCEHC